MASFKFVLAALVALTMASSATTARPLGAETPLAARLQLDDSSDCWGSLFELQSCTSEVIRFFLNGETYLGPDCCRAIHIIEHQCWPAMLGSLGYTAQEGDILRGFCDATDSDLPSPPAPVSIEVKPNGH